MDLPRYQRELQRIDRRLFLEPGPHSKDRGRRVFWVKYRLSAGLPLKILAVTQFDEFRNGASGGWLRRMLWQMDWRDVIEMAKASFTRRLDPRTALGLDRAHAVDTSHARPNAR